MGTPIKCAMHIKENEISLSLTFKVELEKPVLTWLMFFYVVNKIVSLYKA